MCLSEGSTTFATGYGGVAGQDSTLNIGAKGGTLTWLVLKEGEKRCYSLATTSIPPPRKRATNMDSLPGKKGVSHVGGLLSAHPFWSFVTQTRTDLLT